MEIRFCVLLLARPLYQFFNETLACPNAAICTWDKRAVALAFAATIRARIDSGIRPA
jgi:hypothetical protein